MTAKKHIVGVRFNDEERKKLDKQLKVEHLDYVSTLIRKATFWYIDFMNKDKNDQ